MESFDVPFDVSLNEQLISQDAGDLRCHGTDCDIIVMVLSMYSCITNTLLHCVSKINWNCFAKAFYG